MNSAVRSSRRVLDDGDHSFDVVLLEPASPRAAVLFSVGGGGNPDRHLAFLQALAAQGLRIAAPAVAPLANPAPTAAELTARARRLRLALDQVAYADLPVAGVGHSIGAMLLVALAGARARTRTGEAVDIAPALQLSKLALMAPATDFFRTPGALRDLRIPITTWVGARDEITPPSQSQFLQQASPGPVDVRIIPDAGHFSFMNAPPPHATEYLADPDGFRAQLAADVTAVVVS